MLPPKVVGLQPTKEGWTFGDQATLEAIRAGNMSGITPSTIRCYNWKGICKFDRTKAFVVDKATTSMKRRAHCDYNEIIEAEAEDRREVLQATQDTASDIADKWVSEMTRATERAGDWRIPGKMVHRLSKPNACSHPSKTDRKPEAKNHRFFDTKVIGCKKAATLCDVNLK